MPNCTDLHNQNGYAADILFIAALAISKLSVVYFVARLTPHVKYVKLCTVASALCVAWGIGGVFALALRCNLAKPWITIGERCTNMVSLRILRLRGVWRANKQTNSYFAGRLYLPLT